MPDTSHKKCTMVWPFMQDGVMRNHYFLKFMSKMIQCRWAAQDSNRRYQNLFRENKHRTKTATKKVYAFFSMPPPKSDIRSGYPKIPCYASTYNCWQKSSRSLALTSLENASLPLLLSCLCARLRDPTPGKCHRHQIYRAFFFFFFVLRVVCMS